MKNKFYALVFALLSLLFFNFNAVYRGSVKPIKIAEAAADHSEILIERDSLRVLHEFNARQKRGIASTTKILSAITAIENCRLDKKVVIPKEAEGVEGSSIYLKAGEILTVEELLYGLMLRSGNDAAVALAFAVSGSVDGFVRLMNETARRCGAIDSNFKNPHGLDDKEHYSTAYDLALITAHAMKNPIFKKIADTEKINVSNDFYDYPRVLINKNKLLYRDENFDGVKTGYTKKCGRCLVASRTENGMQLIAVVLNVGPMFERCESLLKNGAENYSMTKIVEIGKDYDCNASCDIGKMTLLSQTDLSIPLTADERKDLSVLMVPESMEKTDTVIVKISVLSGKDLIYFCRYAMIKRQ